MKEAQLRLSVFFLRQVHSHVLGDYAQYLSLNTHTLIFSVWLLAIARSDFCIQQLEWLIVVSSSGDLGIYAQSPPKSPS